MKNPINTLKLTIELFISLTVALIPIFGLVYLIYTYNGVIEGITRFFFRG